jgi:23S rRNA (pseudouridine1915-N3)-methyltransferase
MRISVIAVGRMRPPYQDDIEHYRKLIAGHARVELVEVRDEEAIAQRIKERTYVVLLHSEGRAYDSLEFADWLEERRRDGRDLVFVIGGARGLDAELERADVTLSLGPMTLPHQLARVVLMEQLYRAHKILAREPYHY